MWVEIKINQKVENADNLPGPTTNPVGFINNLFKLGRTNFQE